MGAALNMKARFQECVRIVLLFLGTTLSAQPWIPDLGNGRYKNPVLFSDYSDPDVVRVGDDYVMVSSSFNCMPGIPVLHSKDLVNWKIVGHVYQKLPFEKYDKPAHGQGSWAPSIRYHEGRFFVYFCTPREGLFVAIAKNPAGPWDLCRVTDVELWEDPCPLWDDDGRAYLVRSKLRAGVLILHRMSWDGKRILDDGTVIFRDEENQPTIEGPKFLKKDGWYYIFAPAGGVAQGWQTVLRSKNVYGPYESKTVLRRGSTEINGPHQGGIVQAPSGSWWFLHFQDRGAYGRVVHLQPVEWKDGWPVIGTDTDGDGVGEPVLEWPKPGAVYCPTSIPQNSDAFDSGQLGLQWQWHANPKERWFSLTESPGWLRLRASRNPSQQGNLWLAPNLLLQKFPAPSFSATTRIAFHPDRLDEKSGLAVMGREWAFLAFLKTKEGLRLGMFTGTYEEATDKTECIQSIEVQANSCFLKVQVDDMAVCRFLYSFNGEDFLSLGGPFTAAKGTWIGAKVGLFYSNPSLIESKGYADFDWFRIE